MPLLTLLKNENKKKYAGSPTSQFSKTAHFSDQKISNTSKKASWKRTLVNAHYFSEHL